VKNDCWKKGEKRLKLAVCGKGGSGKSVLVALIARGLRARGVTVLVVDSDESNFSLYRTLGFEQAPAALMDLAGGKKNLKKKMGQVNLLNESRIHLDTIPSPYIQRQDGLMLVCIGKIFQALEGCACPMGALTREFLQKVHLEKNEFLIVDLEAGVEHFGRGIETAIDAVLLAVDPSFESIHMAGRVQEMARGVQGGVWAVLNKVETDRVAVILRSQLKNIGLEVIGTVPNDPIISEASMTGSPVRTGKASEQIERILDFLLLH